MLASLICMGAFAVTASVSFLFARDGDSGETALHDSLLCIGAAIAAGFGSILAWFAGALTVNAICTLCFALLIGSATGSVLPTVLGLRSPFPPRS